MSKERKISDTELNKVSGGAGSTHLNTNPDDRDNFIGGAPSAGSGGPDNPGGPESAGGSAGKTGVS